MIQHDDVALRIDGHTERLAEIHVRTELEEIWNRFERNQRNIINDGHVLIRPRLWDAGGRSPALGKNRNRYPQNCYDEENP